MGATWLSARKERTRHAKKPATSTNRRGHSPKWPSGATAAGKSYTPPKWRIGRPGAMAAAAAAWPQAALQRREALEPAPFLPQRLMLHLLEAPKPLTARLRVVTAACALSVAPLVGAEAERSQQIALRAPDQIEARPQWALKPLFKRKPPESFASSEVWPSWSCPSLRHHRALTRWSMRNGRVQFGSMSVLRSSMDCRVKCLARR
jgi:hypothetical protein